MQEDPAYRERFEQDHEQRSQSPLARFPWGAI
jgi:hypothetical protein